jgi:tetratricopeptide (TPR) repeat protein
MDILKANLILAFTALSFISNAQNDQALQQAFSESYSLEYNKKYADAIAVITKQKAEQKYEGMVRLGWLHYLNKQYNQSVQYYQQACGSMPYSIEAKLGLIKPLSALENWNQVVEQYDAILKIDPQHYTANYWSGVIKYNRKQYEAAQKYFEKLINLYPFDYDANHMLSWTYLYLGRKNDARLLFNKTLLIKPEDASCLQGLGLLK